MQDIRKYEAMMKLDLPMDERRKVSAACDRLIGSFAALDAVDTEGVEPLVTVLDVRNVLREDTAAKMLPREELLHDAPARSGGYFQVPKTL